MNWQYLLKRLLLGPQSFLIFLSEWFCCNKLRQRLHQVNATSKPPTGNFAGLLDGLREFTGELRGVENRYVGLEGFGRRRGQRRRRRHPEYGRESRAAARALESRRGGRDRESHARADPRGSIPP